MGVCWKYGVKSEYESASEYNERARSHFIVFYTQFNVVISYSTILISIWPYLNKVDPLAGPTFLGYLISASALGQTIFSPAIGYWSNYLNSTRVPFIASLVVFFLSHWIHACLELFHPVTRTYWLLISRLLAGIGSSNFALCRTHVSCTTLPSERRKVVAVLSSCASVSYALGPAIQSCVLPLGEKGFWLVTDKLSLNMFTAVGWIGMLFTAINLAMFAPSIFKEHPMNHHEQETPADSTIRENNNYKLLAILFVLLNFTISFNMMFLKILGTPLVMVEYAMSRASAIALNSIVVTVGAAVSFVAILLINPLCKFISEMLLLIFALLVMFAGRFALYSFTNNPMTIYNDENANVSDVELLGCPQSSAWCATEGKIFFFQFILSNVLETAGYAIAMTLTMTIFSRVLGAKKQGAWMGFLTGFGSIARMLSPVFNTTVYERYGPSIAVLASNTFFGVICLFAIKTIDYLLINKRATCVVADENVPKQSLEVDNLLSTATKHETVSDDAQELESVITKLSEPNK